MSDPHVLAAAYRAEREALCELVLALDHDTLTRPLPACPEWTAREVVAHLAGVVADVLSGNLADVGSDAWTAAQVNARAGRGIEAVVAEWSEQSPALEALVQGAPPSVGMALVSDACTHHLDVRAGVGDPTGRHGETVAIVFAESLRGLGARLDAAGAPGLIVHTVEGEQHRVGAAEPGARIRGSRFDLLRAMTGRRSPDQVRSFIWDGGCEPYVAVFSRYPMRTDPLDESVDA